MKRTTTLTNLQRLAAPIAATAALMLLVPIGCGDDGGSSGGDNNPQNNSTNNDQNNTQNNSTNNDQNNTQNNSTNNGGDVATCKAACVDTAACTELTSICSAAAITDFSTRCDAACDDEMTRPQILAVAGLDCGTRAGLVVSNFGLEAECGGGGLCDDVVCDDGEFCNANTGACEAAGPCDPDGFEPNNTEDTATQLSTEDTSRDLSICSDDVDFFSFQLPAGSDALITLKFSHAVADLDVEALIDDGVEPFELSAASATDDEYIGIPPQEGAVTVTFAVFAFSEGASAPYSLELDIDPEGDICQSSADCEVEGEICLPERICGVIPPCTIDDDCFAFGFSACNTDTGVCVECQTSDECFSFGAPICDTATNACVECLGNDDCFGDEVCDTTSNACVECLGNEDCAEGVCNTEFGACVECLADGDCTDGTCNLEANVCLPAACNDDPFEPNETVETAAALTAGTHEGLWICLDQDWFTIEVTENDSSLYIAVQFTHEDGDIEAALLEADGTTNIDSSISSEDDEYLTATGLEAGTYVLRVYGFSGAVNSYSLDVRINPTDLTLCAATEDCGADMTCSPRGVCLATDTCAVDRDCPSFGNSICDTDASACVECTKPSDCRSEACDLGTNTCLECDDNDDCFSGACNTDTNMCLECSTDDDCFFGVCSNDGECVDCRVGDDCNSGACDETTNTCLECDDDADCGERVCNVEENICIECRMDADCAEGTCSVAGLCIPADCTPDAAEPNDSREAPASLDGNLMPADTYNTCDRTGDWFSFNVTAGQTITANVLFLNENGDIDATLYNPEGLSISSGSSVTDNETLTAEASTSGVYVLNVRGFLDASNTYTLAITLQ